MYSHSYFVHIVITEKDQTWNLFFRFRPAYSRLADLYSPHNIVIVTHGCGVQEVTLREGRAAVWLDYCSHVELQRASGCSHQWTFVDSKDVLWSH